MKKSSHIERLITIDARDPRLTRVGYFLRRFKIDELPQLINVLKGEMSIVGPRPEIPEYVRLYSTEQKKILDVKPGLTCYASIQYRNESVLLAQQEEPEKYYINFILPDKINRDMKYLNQHNLLTDIKIICATIRKVVQPGPL